MQSNINYDDPSSMTASYTANSEKPNSPSPELWALDTATCNSVFGDTELSMQHPYSQQINEQLNYQRQVFDPQPLMLDQQAFSTALTSTDLPHLSQFGFLPNIEGRPFPSKRGNTLKLRSSSKSPSPRSKPYGNIDRRRAHTSSLSVHSSIQRERLLSQPEIRRRSHTTPDKPQTQHSYYATQSRSRASFDQGQNQLVQHVVNGRIDDDLAKLFNVALSSLASNTSR
eukprot:gene2170-5191_t